MSLVKLCVAVFLILTINGKQLLLDFYKVIMFHFRTYDIQLHTSKGLLIILFLNICSTYSGCMATTGDGGIISKCHEHFSYQYPCDKKQCENDCQTRRGPLTSGDCLDVFEQHICVCTWFC